IFSYAANEEQSAIGEIVFVYSRSRHTRFSRDWSPDVCSSDLELRDPDPPPRVDGQVPDADKFLDARRELTLLAASNPESLGEVWNRTLAHPEQGSVCLGVTEQVVADAAREYRHAPML